MIGRLTVRDLNVSLSGRPVLGPVSTTFEGGSVVGIVGPNGAGKTTLLKALAGLIPAGDSIAIDARPLGSLSERERARAVGFLPQDRECAWPLSVADVVALGRLPHGALDREDPCRRAMTETGTADLADRRMDCLSGGERARVLLARVLAGDPAMILADEPVSGLDPGHALRVLDALTARARAGVMVIAVLHDLTLAARSCDRLLVLHEGALAAEGAPSEVLNESTLHHVFGMRARCLHHEGRLAILPLEASG